MTGLLWPPLLELLVLSALTLYLGIVSEAWRSAPWRMAVVLTLVGWPAMLVAWHGDGQEVTRHTVEGFAAGPAGGVAPLRHRPPGPAPRRAGCPTATEAAAPGDLPDGTPRLDHVEPVGGEGGTAS